MTRALRFGLPAIGAATVLCILGASTPTPKLDPPSPPTFDVVLQESWIPMKDGVRLAADLWRPKGKGDGGPFPVLLEYLPYRKTDSRGSNYDFYAWIARRGYVIARMTRIRPPG